MKLRRRKARFVGNVRVPPPRKADGVQVVCQFFSAHESFDVRLNHKGAKVFEKEIGAALARVYPGVPVRGLWVHPGLKEYAPEPPHALLRYGIQAVCEVFRVPVTEQAVEELKVAINAAASKVYPGIPTRGIWVQAGKGRGSV